jgi:hypothetical protein
LERWIYDESRTYYKILKIPFFVGMLMRRQLKKNAESHGMGRHSQEEVYHIMDSDLKAISDYIGSIYIYIQTCIKRSTLRERKVALSDR